MPDRIPVLSALLASSGKDAIRLYTSALSKVEVSFGAVEKSGHALNPAVEQQITNLWTDPGAIVSVEFHDDIGKEATRLIRDGITQGWSLKPLDAIHLAKAQWLSNAGIQVEEFHTYDKQLYRYATLLSFKILEPYTLEPNLL